MTIIFNSGKTSHNQEQIIKSFVNFVELHFSLPNLRMTFDFIDPATLKGQERKDLEEYSAWMERTARRSFTFTINDAMLNNTQSLLECIGHEMTHVKQYVMGHLRDKANGTVWFNGKIYSNWEYGVGYWLSPWEMEAYMYEKVLAGCFLEITK